MNCQIVHDSWHERGWTSAYLLRLDGRIVGYGLVGGVKPNSRDAIVEFYVLPTHRAAALALFQELAVASRARSIEAQTNDILLTLMLYDCAGMIQSETVLFHDAFTTNLALPGATFRPLAETDAVFPHAVEPVGDWVIVVGREVAATGGILLHYNVPYGDIHMEVAEPFRRRGYGSYLVQELKRSCYEMGKIPAARCNAHNIASRTTLQRAGLLPCARLVTGVLSA
jgi:GNAT superfamily N-acetyltransferase